MFVAVMAGQQLTPEAPVWVERAAEMQSLFALVTPTS